MALVDHIFVHKVNIGLVQPYMPFYGPVQVCTTMYAIIWAGTKPYISQQEMQCHTYV
jgi:hypothetical protein